MNLWLREIIDDLDIQINRFTYLKEMLKGDQRENMEQIVMILNDQKLLLQQIVDGGNIWNGSGNVLTV